MDTLKAVFSSRYAGSVDYYAAMLRYGKVAIDLSEPFDKHHKHLNRMDIVGTNGCQQLSASLQKPNRRMAVGEVALSSHGNWRHTHWGALFSAYGRTPFFDYFADDLKQIYTDESIQTIASLNLTLHAAVIDFLDLDIETAVIDNKNDLAVSDALNLRDGVLTEQTLEPYYQIWSSKFGFQSNQSILDLLFNVGREAVFVLRNAYVVTLSCKTMERDMRRTTSLSSL